MKFARWARPVIPPMTALEAIEAAENQLVALTWNGSPCIVKARHLTDIEIQAIGNFSLIETEEYKWSKANTKTTWGEALEYAEKNVKICMASLVSPTYDKIFETIGKNGFRLEAKAQVEHINKQLEKMPLGPARQELEEIRDSLIIAWCVILPKDFMAGLVVFALRINETDIKKVTEDMLFTVAILADRGHKAPHEYIHGIFSEFNIRDIDTQSWVLLEKHREEMREETRARSGA
jgi:hypothetical protein